MKYPLTVASSVQQYNFNTPNSPIKDMSTSKTSTDNSKDKIYVKLVSILNLKYVYHLDIFNGHVIFFLADK